MRDEDKSAFAALMMGLGELYGKKMSPEFLNIYWRALLPFSLFDILNSFFLLRISTTEY